MGHFGRITSLANLPNEKTLTSYVRKAAELNEKGVAGAVAGPAKKRNRR